MNRIISLFLISIVTSICAIAQTRSEAERMNIAKLILQQSHSINSKGGIQSNYVHPMSEVELLCSSDDILKSQATSYDGQFYIYGYHDGTPGFVIVSGDEHAHAVLGYSTDGVFNINDIPESFYDWMHMYAMRFSNDCISSYTSKSNNSLSNIEPLLGDIAFNQRTPYNDLCPTYDGERCLTGCTAIAMAQVMAYYKFPQRMNGSMDNIEYSTTTNGIKASWNCSSTIFDWSNLRNTYLSRVETETNISTEEHDYFCFSNIGHSDKKGSVGISYFTNVSGDMFSGEMQLLVTDATGKFVALGSETKTIENFQSRYFQKTTSLKLVIPSNIPDASYRVYVAVRKTNSKKWAIVRQAKSDSSSDRYNTSTYKDAYITVVKHNNSINFDGENIVCGYNDTEGKAVATICGACAHAVEADFGLTNTTAIITNLAQALIDYMNYSCFMEYLEPQYFSTDDWHNYLQNELREKRPIIVSGNSDSRSHAFLIDGVEFTDKVPFYHVNWGWNGKSNGYFLLDNMKPSEIGDGGYDVNYGENIRIIGNIKPFTNEKRANLFVCASYSTDKTSYNTEEKLELHMENLSNRTFCNAENYKIYAYAIDNRGNEFVLGKVMEGAELKPRYRFSNLDKKVIIPTTVPTGEYTLELRSQSNGLSEIRKVQSTSTPILYIHNTNNTAIKDIYTEKENSQNGYNLGGFPCDKNSKGIIIKKGVKFIK